MSSRATGRRVALSLGWRRLLALGALLLALTALGLRLSGVLQDADERRIEAWRAAGIDPGEHAPAVDWLAGTNHHLHGLDPAQTERLLQQLVRARAAELFVIGIEPLGDGGELEARGLLVRLPRDPDGRRTILWHRAAIEPGAPGDDGRPFLVIEPP